MNSFFIILISIYFSLNQCDTLSFQENLFNNILQNEKDKNILISPFSIYQILALTSNGASEETLKEMLEVLIPYKNIDNEIQNTINSNLIQIIEKITPKEVTKIENEEDKNGLILDILKNGFVDDCNVTLENANAIFVKKNFTILDEFSLMCSNYKALSSELESVQQVNDWIKNKTHEKIPSVLPNNYNISNIGLILVNAIYFKGSWMKKFKQDTEKRVFKNYDNKKVMVDTMYQSFTYYYYYEDEKIQMISLPYQNSNMDYKMVIILPRDNKYSSSYDYLNKENVNFTKLISKLKIVEEVELYLPKFEIEYEISLNEILKKMGMKKAFSEYDANFNRINDTEKLFIKDFFHKTFIKVDQNGTEAAAVTATIIQVFGSAGPGKIKQRYYMYVNHSFIFFITSNSIKDSDGNNLILFLGTVNNINSTEYENDYNDDNGYNDVDNNENNENKDNDENNEHKDNNEINEHKDNNDNNENKDYNENNDIDNNENKEHNEYKDNYDNNENNENENYNDNYKDNEDNENNVNNENNEKNDVDNNENNENKENNDNKGINDVYDVNNNENNDSNENNDNGNNNSINQNESKEKVENQNESIINEITINQSESRGNRINNIKIYSLLFLIMIMF